VKGLEEAFKALEQLPAKMEKNILRGAIRAAAKPVADDARRRAPVLKVRIRAASPGRSRSPSASGQ
jgi:hypothetical protein